MYRKIYEIMWLDIESEDMVEVVAECENRKWAEIIAKRIHEELGYYIVVDEITQEYVSVKTGQVDLQGWISFGTARRVLKVRE